jgi:dihydrofolate synthase / folylpolyglutamate synthase
MLSYQDALEYMSQFGRFAMKLGTERTRRILDLLDSPDRDLPTVLVGGTNGKGSVGAMLEAILGAAGSRVGFMPKPHLVSYTERIQIDGVPITEDDLAAELETILPVLETVAAESEQPTEFEILTGLALHYLAPRVDQLVCEVGMGGRLDATNALERDVAVITNVALDHQRHLGDTIEEIAREKAGILRPGIPTITGADGSALGVIESVSAHVGAPLRRLGHELRLRSKPLGWDGHLLSVRGPGFEHRDLLIPLVGDYQPANAALAVAAGISLGVREDAAIATGLARTRWPGRLQVIDGRPRIILDAGHNPAALRAVGTTLSRLTGRAPLVVVFATLSERDPAALIDALRDLDAAAVVFTEPALAAQHAIGAPELATSYGADGEALVPAMTALDRAVDIAGRRGNVLVCGTLSLVGEVLAESGIGVDYGLAPLPPAVIADSRAEEEVDRDVAAH